MKKTIIYILFILPIVSSAASFQSLEQSIASMGQAYSGTGTNTDNASIEYYNPAGMAFVKHKELSISGTGILANIRMHNAKATGYNGNTVHGDKRGPQTHGLLPAIHYINPISDKLVFGAGITVPYGLQTRYREDSMAKYFATKSKLETVNLGLSLGYKITNNFSAGFGFDTEYMYAELDQMYDATNTVIGRDLLIRNKGKDIAFGFNLGFLYTLNKKTKISLSYRSEIKHHLKGDSVVVNKDGQEQDINLLKLYDCGVHSDITLPASTTFSIQHYFTNRLLISSDIAYTQWDVIKKVTLSFDNPNHAPKHSSIVLHYRNSWRISIGEKYKLNNKWSIRNGFAFDQTPTNANYRTARIPDANRYWFTFGLNYKRSKKLNIDAGYAIIFFNHSIVNLVTAGDGDFSADYKAYAQLFGIQINYRF